MSCDVCLYGPDDVENAFFAARDVKARKAHRCCECRAEIGAGQTYRRETGKDDGEMFSFATCRLCAEVRDVFHCGSGWYFGTLWDDMESGAFERLTTSSECFRELSPEAKALVLDRWTAWKGL